MIEAVYLKNYKCYGPNGAKFDLKPLTFLYGTNGAGKSTFFQAIKSLRDLERAKQENHKVDTYLESRFIDISFKKKSGPIGIGVALVTKAGPVKLFKRIVSNENGDIVEDKDTLSPRMDSDVRKDALQDFTENMTFIEATRPYSGVAIRTDPSSIMALARDDRLHSESNAKRVTELMSEVGLGEWEFIKGGKLKDLLMGTEVDAIHTGAGVHGAAHTLCAIADMKEGGVLLLEEPETHIAPRFLGKFAKIMVDALHGLPKAQIIVECHSEHMMLAIKGMIRTGALKANEVTVIYVGRSKDGAVVTQVPLEENGAFSKEWPEAGGFYNERRELVMMGEDRIFEVHEK